MQQIGTVLPAIQRNTTASKPSLPDASSATPVLLHDQNGRETLTVMLSQSFRALKLYGREPEDFAAIDAMFQLVLADYPIDKIKQAFAVYLKRHNELPAPADIAQIIERVFDVRVALVGMLDPAYGAIGELMVGIDQQRLDAAGGGGLCDLRQIVTAKVLGAGLIELFV